MKRESPLHVVIPEPEPVKDDRVGLMNPKFKYTRSGETDVAKTFARIRRELAAQKERTQAMNIRFCEGGERVSNGQTASRCSGCVNGICASALACELPEPTPRLRLLDWLRSFWRWC